MAEVHIMFVDALNVHTYLTETGTGSPVLLLHGIPDTGEMWSPIVARLRDRYTCYAPDLPGLGRSEAPAGFEISLDSMAQFVDALVDRAAIPTPLDLVLADWGGTYGLAWAVKHPERVRRIALAGSVNFFADYRWHPNARTLRQPVVGELAMGMMRSYAIFARSMKPNTPALGDEHWRPVYALSFAQPAVRRMALRMYRAIDSAQFAGWQDKLLALTERVPMLVLWGDRDPFISPSYADRYNAQGGATVVHFPEYGHWLAIEAPDLVADRLLQFLG